MCVAVDRGSISVDHQKGSQFFLEFVSFLLLDSSDKVDRARNTGFHGISPILSAKLFDDSFYCRELFRLPLKCCDVFMVTEQEQTIIVPHCEIQ